MKDATPLANGESDLRQLFGYRPYAIRHLPAFTQAVMRVWLGVRGTMPPPKSSSAHAVSR